MSKKYDPLKEDKKPNRSLERFFIFVSSVLTLILVIPTFANGKIYSMIDLSRNIHGFIFVIIGILLLYCFSLSEKPLKARLTGIIALICGIASFVVGPLYYLAALPVLAGISLIIRGEYIFTIDELD